MGKTIVPPRRVLSKVFLLFGVALVFFAGFLAGGAYELNRQQLNLSEFWQVYSVVDKEFVGQIDKKKAVDGVTRGFIDSLGDPFSSFLSSEERNTLSEELSGEFEGIGARLETKNDAITVVAPLSGSPAEKAGMKPNDIILTIDGESTEKMTLDQAVSKIRGKAGTEVTLSIFRQGKDVPLELKVNREAISIPSVTWKMMGTVAYMEIAQFGDDTIELAQKGFAELNAKNPTAFIMDLRNNPGGYLDDVAPIAGAFLPPSVITTQKFKFKKSEDVRSTQVPTFPNTKLLVLVNEGSASAAEILAGALQDYGRAQIIGQKTFGKGSVQDIIPLGKGNSLRLTVAEWLTPKGRSVNKEGIKPDVLVEGEVTATSDPALDKALELAR
ncbi:MAG: S41 family peptidase [Candidatus Berkelbacteria bacterium]|nr:MAG: S41 family peptidase [Candidatus Berkelbacteria bacterium]QQG51564.1 MAG: S41 family peptidase [Candidatus Berkelbacteria bacterium]